jgi:hypothetical protein
VNLKQVCPAKIVVQTDWNPEAEHGPTYEMLGPDPKIDAGGKKVVGPLFAHGQYTGVDLEIRAGGPAIGFQSVTSQMYQDTSIMFGYTDTDHSVQTAAKNPTTGVFAPLKINPQMIMWDPATYPNVHTIADLKAAKATVLYYQGDPYIGLPPRRGHTRQEPGGRQLRRHARHLRRRGRQEGPAGFRQLRAVSVRAEDRPVA